MESPATAHIVPELTRCKIRVPPAGYPPNSLSTSPGGGSRNDTSAGTSAKSWRTAFSSYGVGSGRSSKVMRGAFEVPSPAAAVVQHTEADPVTANFAWLARKKSPLAGPPKWCIRQVTGRPARQQRRTVAWSGGAAGGPRRTGGGGRSSTPLPAPRPPQSPATI